APVMWSWRPGLRATWLGRNALRMAWPPVHRVLERWAFGERPDLLWIGNLPMASLVRAIPARRVAYHAHDLFMDYPGAPPQLRARERWWIGRADGVFATSAETADALVTRYRVDRAKVHLLGHGVHLERYRPAPEPPDLAAIPRPRAVVLGTLGSVDVELVRTL